MKKIYWISLMALGLLLAACSVSGTTKSSDGAAPEKSVAVTADYVPQQIVVGYENEADLDGILQALGDGAEVVSTIPELNAALVEIPDGLDVGVALGKLGSKKVAGLRYAQPNFKVELPQPADNAATLALNDPLESEKWDHQIMQAADAWATDVDGNGTTPDGSGVVVGVVDTGIDGLHPDLYGSFVQGFDATGVLGLPGGVIPPNYDATQGFLIHGTHVAGIIAARGDNGQGVAGVAYKATLMDLKVFSGSYTSDYTIAYAVNAAINDYDGDGIVPDVITMSLGGKGYGQILKDALDSATSGYNVYTGAALPLYDDGTAGGVAGDGVPDRTVTVTVAMANSYQDEVFYPAGYPGIIAVGATNARDEKADFSTSGKHISVSAPGVDILSTWPRWDVDNTGHPYLYYRISGTSMATPEVAGAVALVKQFLPGASAYEVRRLLETTADDIGPAGFDNGTGWGRINLKKLVDKVHDVLAGTVATEPGGTAAIHVTTANVYDTDGDGTLGSAGDVPYDLPAVDVQLLQGGEVKYVAKTNGSGQAIFSQVAPGDYQVMVAGQDITDWSGDAYWPYERVAWDADGDPANGVTLGTLTVNAGSDLATPDALEATLDSTLHVTLSWIGGGDLDLAIMEYDPSAGSYVWSTPKTGALWGSFSGDDTGASATAASESYALAATHYPYDWYNVSIDATNAAVGTTASLRITVNGQTHEYGPITVVPGSSPDTNDWNIFNILFFGNQGFDNEPLVY